MFTRTVRLALTVVIAMALSLVGLGGITSSAHAAGTPHLERGARALAAPCTASVALWEDGTWMGTTLRRHGVVIAERWDVTDLERRGMHLGTYGVAWPATLTDGTPCRVVLEGARRVDVLAPCRASVVLWEDGTWSGTTLRRHGVVIAEHWDVTTPDARGEVAGTYGVPWPVTLADGTPCRVVL